MYFALDIGGTSIRIAGKRDLSTRDLELTRKISIRNSYETDLQSIVTNIEEMANSELIDAVGCGVPATFSEDRKDLLVAANLSDWSHKPFASDLEHALKCTVRMENDDTVAALGEAVYGQGAGKEFVYITWGTGLGAAYVSRQNDNPVAYQFEAGHQIIDWDSDEVCGCGQKGCAEAFVGGGNIVKHYGKPLSQLTPEQQHEVYERLANALINVVAFRPVQLIILGGGVAIEQGSSISAVRDIMAQRLKIVAVPELVVTKLGDDLGLYGAFTLLR